MDYLCANGFKFTNAISHGGGTPEAFPSILCSVPPPYNLDDRNVWHCKTLAEYLKEASFSTAAFHSNPYLTRTFGFHKGFDFFFEGEENIFMKNNFLEALGILNNQAPIIDAKKLTSKCIEWMKHAQKPFFIWIHYMDAHFPYLPSVSISGIKLSLKGRILWPFLLGMKIQRKYYKKPPSFKETLALLYKKSIASIDVEINRLVREIFRLSENPLIILTADHGEAFWEHHIFGHSSVYDEIIRVPLIFFAKNLKGNFNHQVGHSIILPTLLDLLDIDYNNATFYSQSLSHIEHDIPVISVSLDPPLGTRTISYRTPFYKYIRRENFDGTLLHEELYLLKEDPFERINRVRIRRDLADEANTAIDKYVQDRKKFNERKKLLKKIKGLRTKIVGKRS
jgi:arylsulfatase